MPTPHDLNVYLRAQTRTGAAVLLAAALILLSVQHHSLRRGALEHSNAIVIRTTPYLTASTDMGARPAISAHTEQSSGPQPCAELSSAANNAGLGYTANEIAQAYTITPLYQAGDTGAGQTIAVLELEPDSPADISAFQSCYGTNTTVSYNQIDGGAGTGPGEGEAALDIEQLIATAPGATIDVYQAPNTASGILDAYQAMVNNPATTVIVSSWGTCEAAASPVLTQEAAIFAQATQKHITTIAAAGDSGSTDCQTSTLSVDDPASNPNVTAVGGTSLPNAATPATQSVWNDSGSQQGAGGGGVSTIWTMPAWQTALAHASYQQAIAENDPACATPDAGGCRTIPDVAADADPYTGYWMIHTNPSTSVQDADLYGGTSAAAPLWAGIVALINSSAACNDQNVGDLNPTLYEIANSGSYSTLFTDITQGTNNYAPDNPAGDDYPASTGYDLASGLGSPNVTNLAKAICAAQEQLSLTNPGDQQATAGASTTINLTGSDSDSHALTYSAVDLPQGLAINPADGQITGTPTTAGAWPATVTATAASTGVHQSITFTITVAASAQTAPTPAPETTSSQQGQGGGEQTTTTAPSTTKTPTTTTSVALTKIIDGHRLTLTLTAPTPTTVRVRVTSAAQLKAAQITLTVLERVKNKTKTVIETIARARGAFTLKLPAGASITRAALTIRYRAKAEQHVKVALTASMHRLTRPLPTP